MKENLRMQSIKLTGVCTSYVTIMSRNTWPYTRPHTVSFQQVVGSVDRHSLHT